MTYDRLITELAVVQSCMRRYLYDGALYNHWRDEERRLLHDLSRLEQ
jgi:hypothetical protein